MRRASPRFPPRGAAAIVLGWALYTGPSLVALAVAPPETEAGLACALPVVLRAGLRDIHESSLNGPEGFAFIAGQGGEKTGDLPAAVGRDPRRTFDTDVYASNFQGPVRVVHPGLRTQWEWTADGEVQTSDRSYPLLAARSCARSASALPAVTLRIDEHDEPPWRNDPVGAFTLELGGCAPVLADGRRSGWTAAHSADGQPYDDQDGPGDVVFVDYATWCYRCDGEADCGEGIE